MTTLLAGLLAEIPSPSSNEIVVGPLHLRAYGLMIAIGVIAAVEMARRRWAARGHDPDQISGMALWAVPAGLIGSRVYHVITDWQRFDDGQWLDAVKIWEGGLGIPGGIAFGAAAGLIYARKKGMPLAEFADSTVPALPLAQAIGRFGNWFNQELFGRPTDLPWGLQIDITQRPDGYVQYDTFHPTFLYEALWNLALVFLLLWIDKKRVLKPGRLVWVYIGGYFAGRLWVEALRIDPASLVFGVRVNIWVSIVAVLVSATVLVVSGRRRSEGEADPDEAAGDEPGPDDETAGDEPGPEDEAAGGEPGPEDETVGPEPEPEDAS